MTICNLDKLTQAKDLVLLAQDSDEPIIVCKDEEECLVVMRPSVFERFLYESDYLKCSLQTSMHL